MQTEATSTHWVIDPVHTRIRFESKYLLLTSVSGWFNEFEGTVRSSAENFTNSEVNVTIYSQSLYTGNEERDNHLRSPDFFDAMNHPIISFRSKQVEAVAQELRVKGDLIIKNITQTIEFTCRYIGSICDPQGNKKAGLVADIALNRKDFNITWNQYLDNYGVVVSDEVNLHCDIQLLKLK
ncbi:MAG: YceI family protein [Chitinophagaceae bacterium]|nr:YceI family protein [Chitinophagaceae bacterium]